MKIEVHEKAPAATGISAGEQSIRYANGPIIKPAELADIPDYETLATFRTELAENGSPKGAMVNSPAWARSTFGKGRVIISSPHPEQTAGMDAFVASAVKWAAGR